MPTQGNNTPTLSLAVSWTLTPVSAPTFTPLSTDELFKQFMKAYLESNQRPSQLLAERKQTLKAKVLNVYYGKLYIDCYYFCHQCEDYFETFWATRTNRTPFATFFFRGNISVQWTQYKHYRGEEVARIT